MIEGSYDVKNMKAGDKIANGEECVGAIHIAVIKCKESDAVQILPDFSFSKGTFKDLVRAVVEIKEWLEQIEPDITEKENLRHEVNEFIKKLNADKAAEHKNDETI